MPLDRTGLQAALAKTPGSSAEGIDTPHTLLCRRGASAFQRAAKQGDDLVVCCTQESRLFLELNGETAGAPGLQERPIRFVNIRETGGWSKDATQATPKLAALIAAAQLPAPDPVATVSYMSGGRCLVIGAADAAERAAAMLGAGLQVSVLVEGGAGALAQRHELATHSGRLTRLTGWLGAFHATWDSGNPIDLDLCTRCNACVAVCPEGAIDFSYRIDLARCIARAVRAAGPQLILLAPALSALVRAGREAGLAVVEEIFADRQYTDEGHLVPRSHPQAMVHGAEASVHHVMAMLDSAALVSIHGKRLPCAAGSICVHGDNAQAVATAQAVRAALRAAGYRLSTLPELTV